MARFKVYRMAQSEGLAIDLQSTLFDGLQTRVMAPLVPITDVAKLIPRLNPRFEINDTVYVMLTEFMGTVPSAEIGMLVADLSARADDITAATDFLFQGF
ncbi:CcdB family protein [Rhizobium sp. FY34]|uniref:CcdB family protein n=1 Tax=Rhizobium sp. FY34 TaxID=2562309 RepID=UPI0010C08F71|nr:CcdB family protein [Rhizobium sp. FY34]